MSDGPRPAGAGPEALHRCPAATPGSADERIFVGLGSNLAGPVAQLRAAIAVLAATPECQLAGCSALYRTAPWGIEDQPSFVNAVLELRSTLSPRALMAALLAIETRLGRERALRWGPRVIDLDLLAWGDRRIDEPALTVPHPRITERDFVLIPWATVAADFVISGVGSVSALAAALEDTGRPRPQPIAESLECTERTRNAAR